MMTNYMKPIGFSILFLFGLVGLNAQPTLCEQYAGIPFDVTINNDNASDYAGHSFVGEHVLFEGKLTLDSDITFNGAVIKVVGTLKMLQTSTPSTVTFNGCKVYADCDGFYSFLVKAEQFIGTSLKVYNSKFEGFAELFHLQSPHIIDFVGNDFTGGENLGEGHVFHLLDFDSDNSQQSFRFQGNTLEASSGVWLDQTTGVKLSGNTYLNCTQGAIVCNQIQDVIIEESNFINCKSAFKSGSNPGYFIGNKNILQNVETAFDMGNVANIYLNGNELTNNNIGGDKFLVSGSGNSFIISNIINDNYLGNVKTAFSMNGGGNVIAHFNNYNATAGAYMFNVSGKNYMDGSFNISNGGRIYLKGIDEIDFSNNEVDAKYMKFAFRTDMSNGTFCTNKGRNASKVFSFRGNCMNTDFSNNEIGTPFTISTGTGLFVDDVIGQQEHKANLWNAGYSVEGATNTSNFPLLSLITINPDPNQGGSLLFIPQNNSYSPGNWFAPEFTTTSFANCQTSNFTTSGGPGDQVTNVDREVIRGTYNTTPLSNWLAIRNLIRKLTAHPTLLNDVEANIWYQAQLGTALNTVAEVENAIAIYYGTPSEVKDIHLLLDDYVMHMNALSLLNPGNSGYQAIVDDINQVKNDIHTIQSTIDNRQATICSNGISMLNSMNSSNDYEVLFKEIYTIYIKYLQDDDYNLTSNEIHIIGEATNLCPLIYGPSIYVSQFIADQYKIPYDEESCNSTRIRSSKKEDEKVSDLIVYPNPSSNILNVKSSIMINEVRLYDTQMNLRLITNESRIDISNIQPGIYICEAYGDNEMIGRQKIVVLK